jgi:regulatory protein
MRNRASPSSSLSLKARALRYLSMREYSTQALMRKLEPYVADGENLELLLTELQSKGWLSDERAAQSLVRQQSVRYGLLRIRHELRQQGIDAEMAQPQLLELQETELERALAVWMKKFTEAPADAPTQAKHMRFLIGRGFSPSVAQRVMKKVKHDFPGSFDASV